MKFAIMKFYARWAIGYLLRGHGKRMIYSIRALHGKLFAWLQKEVESCLTKWNYTNFSRTVILSS